MAHNTWFVAGLMREISCRLTEKYRGELPENFLIHIAESMVIESFGKKKKIWIVLDTHNGFITEVIIRSAAAKP